MKLRTLLFLLSLAAAASSASDSEELNGPVASEGFREVGLRYHNYYRKLNKAQPLALDQELNKLAHAHAEKLALWNNLTASALGFEENLWSHRGELLPLSKDLEYAIKCWYTGSMAPGRVEYSIDHEALRSDFVKSVGFGVGTNEIGGDGYSVVVALYS